MRVLVFSVTVLILFAFLVLLLCLPLGIILRTGLSLRRRCLTVPPHRCILIFHMIHPDSASDADRNGADCRNPV